MGKWGNKGKWDPFSQEYWQHQMLFKICLSAQEHRDKGSLHHCLLYLFKCGYGCRLSKLKAWTGRGLKLEHFTTDGLWFRGEGEKYSYEKFLYALQPPSFIVWVDLFGLRATKVCGFGLKIFSLTYLLTGMSIWHHFCVHKFFSIHF